jgi:hypothetical protein
MRHHQTCHHFTIRSIPFLYIFHSVLPISSHILHVTVMAPNLTLFSVNAILILSTDDSTRILAKYYSAPHPPVGTQAGSTNYPGANPYPTLKEQKAFEKGLLEKTVKQTSDVILYDNRVVVFKPESDVILVRASFTNFRGATADMEHSTWLEVQTKMKYCYSTWCSHCATR